ncbi:hypothetical protein GCM10010446_52830 [Streptomyces enissocaesilis]|uniref:Transposase n=1 Tax=Streptomyces enissocaesilis TaxID=332589 RepID=A0ABN3XLS6_9ACTN
MGVVDVAKLNQIIAVEKGVKAKAQQDLTAAHHGLRKPALLTDTSFAADRRTDRAGAMRVEMPVRFRPAELRSGLGGRPCPRVRLLRARAGRGAAGRSVFPIFRKPSCATPGARGGSRIR